MSSPELFTKRIHGSRPQVPGRLEAGLGDCPHLKMRKQRLGSWGQVGRGRVEVGLASPRPVHLATGSWKSIPCFEYFTYSRVISHFPVPQLCESRRSTPDRAPAPPPALPSSVSAGGTDATWEHDESGRQGVENVLEKNRR